MHWLRADQSSWGRRHCKPNCLKSCTTRAASPPPNAGTQTLLVEQAASLLLLARFSSLQQSVELSGCALQDAWRGRLAGAAPAVGASRLLPSRGIRLALIEGRRAAPKQSAWLYAPTRGAPSLQPAAQRLSPFAAGGEGEQGAGAAGVKLPACGLEPSPALPCRHSRTARAPGLARAAMPAPATLALRWIAVD